VSAAAREGCGSGAQALRVVGPSRAGRRNQRASAELQRQAWQWALANRVGDGTLASGKAIAHAHGRGEWWGRLVKNAGLTGAFSSEHAPAPRLVDDDGNDSARSAP
jgi:hypothetical protein